jgi:isopenicillin-N epimerase
MRSLWGLDPRVTYLNHGTVGVAPKSVLARQQAIRDEIERQPAAFLLRSLLNWVQSPSSGPPRIRLAADAVAAFLGVSGEDLAFTDNATAGINAVLRSVPLQHGDEILTIDLAYGAIKNVAAFAARERGATVRVLAAPYPPFDPDAFIEAWDAALTPRTRIAVVDHITSESALILPVQALAERCRRKGVPLLVDGAHAPGAIPVDIASLGVDWYAANLHKWAFAPRSCGVLWASRARQAGLHPPVVSWNLDQGFTAEFDWVGTRDPSPWLAAPAGVEFLDSLGRSAVYEWNHRLAWDAARLLASRWETELPVREAAIGTMAAVPVPARLGSTTEEAQRLRDTLLFKHGIEVQVHAAYARVWVRVSAQVYNEIADVERLADVVAAL